MKKVIVSISIIIILAIVIVAIIFYFNARQIESDNEKIAEILDKAILSDNPQEVFQQVLPEIGKFKSVERAWINGNTFFVKYKNGGQVSWMDTSHGED